MSGTKCRLCDCLVDKQTGFSCSLNDDGFQNMIKTVFPFPISPVHKVASKSYNMPVLVCFQCSTAIRNFYNFSKQVEVIQSKLKRECMGKDETLPIEQLVQYIKAEPGLQAGLNENANESLMMSADVEDSECESEENVFPMHENEEENNSDRPIGQEYKWPSHEPISCVDRAEVVNNIVNVERRVNMVAKKLERILQNSMNPRQQQYNSSQTRNSFEFSPITNEESCVSFNDKLAEKEYMDKMASSLAGNISSNESRERMHQCLDFIFSRQFMASCSWTGVSRSPVPKVAFRKFKNILELFRLVGTSNAEHVNDEAVVNFFITKLSNAKQRLNTRGINKSVSHRPFKRTSRVNKT